MLMIDRCVIQAEFKGGVVGETESLWAEDSRRRYMYVLDCGSDFSDWDQYDLHLAAGVSTFLHYCRIICVIQLILHA